MFLDVGRNFRNLLFQSNWTGADYYFLLSMYTRQNKIRVQMTSRTDPGWRGCELSYA